MSKPVSTLEDQLESLPNTAPCSEEAERGLLSCLLQDPAERLAEARIHLPPEGFHHPHCRTIYICLLGMLDSGIGFDIATLSTVLRDQGLLEKVGGAVTLSELWTFVPTAAHFPFYLRQLQDKHELRKLMAICADAIAASQAHDLSDGPSVTDIVAAVQERIIALSSQRDAEGVKTWRELVMEAMDDVVDAFENKGHIPLNRTATGFTGLDRRSGGLEGGQLVVIAARPSMGKTSLAMNIVENVAEGIGHYREFNHPKRAVLVFSLEMPGKSLARRDLVGGAGVNLQQVKFGLGTKGSAAQRGDLERIGERAKRSVHRHIYAVEKPGISIQEAKSRARVIVGRHRARHPDVPFGLIVVDYLQLMVSNSKKAAGNRAVEIGEIANGLKAMALELGIPVIALAQLSRSAEETKGAIPQLKHLREGGDIEQSADAVCMVHRPWYYDHDYEDETESNLIVAKGRDWGVGEIPLQFIAETTRFSSLTDSLLSNDPDKRDKGYQSKPQPSKQKGKEPWRPNGPQTPSPAPKPAMRQPQLGEFMPAPDSD
jgi:replicative DNA helicase